MSYIIIVDHRENNNGVTALLDKDDNIEIFKNKNDVNNALLNNTLCQNFTTMVIDLHIQEIINVI